MDRAYLKLMAKLQIRGKIGVLFLCSLIIYGISVLCSMTGVGAVVFLVISPVLTFGLVLNSLQISGGGDADVKLMFEGFKGDSFGKIWLTYFLVELYIALWSLLLIIPGIVKMYAYMFAPYILADNPTLSPREAIEKSKQMTDGHKMDLFVLNLSFIGWYLLVAITFGIAGIYVTPYYNTTLANAYNSLKGGSFEVYDNVQEEPFEEEEIAEETSDEPQIPPVDEDLMNKLS